jgi:hypothetical protein
MLLPYVSRQVLSTTTFSMASRDSRVNENSHEVQDEQHRDPAKGSQAATPSTGSSLKEKAAVSMTPPIEGDVLVVDWDGPDDPANPKN